MPGTEPTSKLLECVCEFVGRGEGGGGGEAGRAMNREWKREKTDAKVFNSCSRVTGTEN